MQQLMRYGINLEVVGGVCNISLLTQLSLNGNHHPRCYMCTAVMQVVAILRGDNGHAGSSILTTSNLRRSIATCLICLWDRLEII